MKPDWNQRTVALELTAKCLEYPTKEFAEALFSGEAFRTASEYKLEYADLLKPYSTYSAESAGLDLADESFGHENIENQGKTTALASRKAEEIFEILRIEHSKLFYTLPQAAVPPYGSTWFARRNGLRVMQGANQECKAVQDFYRACGLERMGANEPADHIATELEFLEFLAAAAGGLVSVDEASLPGGSAGKAWGSFMEKHVRSWVGDFAEAVLSNTSEPSLRFACLTLLSLLKSFDALK